MSVFRRGSDRGRRVSALLRSAAALAVALIGLPVLAAAQTGRLPRVVSMNVCTDQLLLALAEPEQILSLSYLVRDPALSLAHAAAQAYPVNRGGAEEIYLLHPDVVLADTWSNPGSISMMRRLGLRVVQMDPGTSLEGIRSRITEVGRQIGQPERAAAMLAAFDARLAAITRPRPGLRAAIYGTGGYGYGPGTLEGQILALAGFDNVIGGLGLDFGGPLPLERLVMAAPDVVLLGGTEYRQGTSRAQAMLAHPAMAGLPRLSHLRDARWVCGGPAMLDAVQELANLGLEIEKEKQSQ